MSLFIKFENSIAVWKVGNKQRPKEIHGEDLKVLSVTADGHELEFINNKFINLPAIDYAKVVKWRGDLAQFIYDNL